MANQWIADNTLSAEKPPDWIEKGTCVYDGDWISLRNLAWGGTTIKRNGTAPYVTAIKLRGGDLVKANKLPEKVRQGNEYTWCVRLINLNPETKTWQVLSPDFNHRKKLTYGQPFLLYMPGEAATHCMGTRVPSHLATANNGDYRVETTRYSLETVNGVCEIRDGYGFREWTEKEKCLDFIDSSVCIWYCEPKNHNTLNTPVNFGEEMYVRNLYTYIKTQTLTPSARDRFFAGLKSSVFAGQIIVLINLAMKFNGGRNLTQAKGSNGSTVKLALSNHDKDDKSLWIMDSYMGNHYPVRRNVAASGLEMCRPGYLRHFVDGTCRPPTVGCPPQSIRNQQGKCVTGTCPSGATRDSLGYCTDPSAMLLTDKGEINVLYESRAHENWLSTLSAEEQAAQREYEATQKVPDGWVRTSDGRMVQIRESGGVQLETSPPPAKKKPGQSTFNPITNEFENSGWKNDHRNWFEQLFFDVFGYNWNEIPGWKRDAMALALAGAIGLAGYNVVIVSTTRVTQKVADKVL